MENFKELFEHIDKMNERMKEQMKVDKKDFEELKRLIKKIKK